ncbi:ABC transporter ATP-binding protein [Nonomuraea endophytica]|uniref:ABC-2 type transport system ATP-binding protein n=1 Tax=Nonomuraea endophytica TaxID=714136 RepID=A0A7W8A9Q1_9ACTN|nr:ATP-binding cassette domain-containing protein [Nonomuraea endophytica]MBB5081634.1 ABC-2 type transport system ATP-binding protein [Nonomuraea endophytica]
MEASIEVDGLRKRFGAVAALDGMSFTVAPGRVTGFVGPSGAGKSTTLRVVLGLDVAQEGRALVGGRPYRSLGEPSRHVGALLDAGALQPGRTARNHLLWLAHAQGAGARRVDEVAELVGLGAAIRRRAGSLSHGSRQRLGLAAALLGDPPILVLDEPFTGLDPQEAAWLGGVLRGLAGEGRAVLVASRLMSRVQDTAGHLVVAGRGRVVADLGVDELVADASRGRFTVRTGAREAAMAVLAGAGATVAACGPEVLTVSGLAGRERVEQVLNGAAVPYTEIVAHRATLEEAYMELTR